MSILAGTNSSTAVTNDGKPLSANVTTAWEKGEGDLSSDILRLDGMSKITGEQTDQYVLSMSFKTSIRERILIRMGRFGLLAKNTMGKWVNAIRLNTPATGKFVLGPWKASYGLGTHGVDLASNPAWAVLNYNGDFSVGEFRKP